MIVLPLRTPSEEGPGTARARPGRAGVRGALPRAVPAAALLARRLTGDVHLPRTWRRRPSPAPTRDGARWRRSTREGLGPARDDELAVDHMRKQRTSRRFAAMFVAPSHGHDEGGRRRLADGVVAALSALPQRQREAIALVYLAGLTDQEASSSLGLSASTVRTHVQRGLENLRETLVCAGGGACRSWLTTRPSRTGRLCSRRPGRAGAPCVAVACPAACAGPRRRGRARPGARAGRAVAATEVPVSSTS